MKHIYISVKLFGFFKHFFGCSEGVFVLCDRVRSGTLSTREPMSRFNRHSCLMGKYRWYVLTLKLVFVTLCCGVSSQMIIPACHSAELMLQEVVSLLLLWSGP